MKKKIGGKRARGISQFFKFVFDIRELEPDCAVGNLLVVEEKAYAPYGGREAHAFCGGEIVEDDFGLG